MTASRRRQIDMLNGPLPKNLIRFALPLAATSILQQLFNSVDVAVVGQFAGSEALAAVGANVPTVGVFVNLLVGLSIGPNVVIANLIGQGKPDEANRAAHTAIALALTAGLLLMAVGLLASRPLLLWIDTPLDILPMALRYFRIYLIGVPFLTVYNFGAAILRSVGDTKRPLYCMIATGIANVVLNLFTVLVLHMAVVGVALATTISNVLSAVIILIILVRQTGAVHLSLRRVRFHRSLLGRILRVGIPTGVQGMIFAVSNVFIQAAINGFGSYAMAGSSAALNFEYFTYFVSASFSQAAVTFTSHCYGAGAFDRCARIFRWSLLEGMVFTAILSSIFTVGLPFFIGLYTPDPVVMSFARIRMLHVMTLEALTATYEVGCSALRGIGTVYLPTVLTIIGTVGLRLVWLATVFARIPTFEMLMNVYPVTWVITGCMVLTSYAIILRRRKTRGWVKAL